MEVPKYYVNLKAEGWVEVEAENEEDAEKQVRWMPTSTLLREMERPEIMDVNEKRY